MLSVSDGRTQWIIDHECIIKTASVLENYQAIMYQVWDVVVNLCVPVNNSSKWST